MNPIFWTCVVMISSEPYYVMGTMHTRDHCENVASKYEPPSIYNSSIECYPVNVTDPKEVLKQVRAINIVTKSILK
tara:strand:+ start:1300 stop:1527 length:228 start_codon:yes stop_codon:yes gene_type:complete